MDNISEHLLDGDLKRYIDHELDRSELLMVDEHLFACDSCSARLAAMRPDREFSDVFQSALEEFEHLSYSQLESYVDAKADAVDREIVEVHLERCAHCAKELEDIYKMRSMIAADLDRADGQASFLNAVRGLFAVNFLPKIAASALAFMLLLLGGYWLATRDVPSELAFDAPTPIVEAPTNENTDTNGEADASTPASTPTETQIYPPEYKAGIEEVLAENRLNFPADLEQLKVGTGKLMSGGSPEVPFALSGPVGKIVLTDRPQFRWSKLKEAESYVVNVYDEDFNKLASSPEISTTNWQMNRALPRGQVYLWQVTAIKDGEEIKSPVRPAPDARFKVLDARRANELSGLSREYKNEHLFLGIMYARAGLIAEAESEFQKELNKNPSSRHARKFLQEVRKRR